MNTAIHVLLKRWLGRLVPPVEHGQREAAVGRAVTREADTAGQPSAQEQRMASDIVASMGTLAANLAHQVNNPLASVIANLHVAAEGLARLAAELSPPETEPIALSLRDAMEGAERIRIIVRDLRAFSRAAEAQEGESGVHQGDLASAAARASQRMLGFDMVAVHRGRVMVVDDEPMLVAALRRVLSVEHAVVGCTSGREALAVLAAGEPCDVILCDLMMPEMSGMELHAEVARRFPQLAQRFVFMCGSVHAPRVREFLARTTNPWIEKPFDPFSVRRLIDARVCVDRSPCSPPGAEGASRGMPAPPP